MESFDQLASQYEPMIHKIIIHSLNICKKKLGDICSKHWKIGGMMDGFKFNSLLVDDKNLNQRICVN